ncbi:MAG TPA: hypothetical protein PLT93_11195 [Phycisphaerae bacterium]|nr:hypothetical protein [Phycisphaerae bacterium]
MRYAIGISILVLAVDAVTFAQATRPASTRPADEGSIVPAVAAARDYAELRREQDLATLDAFLAELKSSSSLQPAARDAVDRLWAQRRADDDPRAFVTSALAVISAEYRKASNELDAGNADAAIEAAKPLMDSPEFHLSTHAVMITARALIEQDRPSEARELLEKLNEQREELEKRTFVAPEMVFLLGYCRLLDLDYEGATNALREFEQRYPHAPDPYRLPARQMLQELAARQPETLSDVSDLMGYAGRQLKYARVNDVVRSRQDRAVELLDRLIEEAEQREQQQQQQQQDQQQQQQNGCKKCGGKGCPDCPSGGAAGNQQPQRGADRSVAPPGQGRIGELHGSARARPGEQWGKMRPEERERVMQSLRQNYPSRYRQLVEQYYRQLSKEE